MSLNFHFRKDCRQLIYFRRYQSITNWFQTQRSISRKKIQEEIDAGARLQSDYAFERQFSAYPPSHGPSLASGSSSNIHSLPYDRTRGAADYPHADESAYRKHSPRRYSAPYSTSSSFSRPRRSRPEPYQLDALKVLFTKTPTPSIEERSALAAEIGM